MTYESLLDIIEVCENWAKTNDMNINQKKSKIMIISDTMRITKFEREHNLNILGYELVTKYKSLGVIV